MKQPQQTQKGKLDDPIQWFEVRTLMDSGDMQDEVNQLLINGVDVSIIHGKVGVVGEHKRIYDYDNDVVIMRYRKTKLS